MYKKRKISWAMKARIILALSWATVGMHYLGRAKKNSKNFGVKFCCNVIRKKIPYEKRREIMRNSHISASDINADASLLILHYIINPRSRFFHELVNDLWEYYLHDGSKFFDPYYGYEKIRRKYV